MWNTARPPSTSTVSPFDLGSEPKNARTGSASESRVSSGMNWSPHD
jgi:hypothetical protein